MLGRIVGASNATLVARASLPGGGAGGAGGAGGESLVCVYKPVAGEQPLWDFPDGTLAGREAAASLVSDAGGWGVVPPTVLRDGPLGTGSVQLWVGPSGAGDGDGGDDGDGAGGREPLDGRELALRAALLEPGAGVIDVVAPGEVPAGWLTVIEGSGARGAPVVLAHADEPALARMAAFDALANNADRKGGHVLRSAAGAVHGIDHGLTFHAEPKLRTVLWGFAGRRLGDGVAARVRATREALDAELGEALRPLLTRPERRALVERCDRLLERGRFPKPRAGAHVLPWPPF